LCVSIWLHLQLHPLQFSVRRHGQLSQLAAVFLTKGPTSHPHLSSVDTWKSPLFFPSLSFPQYPSLSKLFPKSSQVENAYNVFLISTVTHGLF
jgi:hypothetical protein